MSLITNLGGKTLKITREKLFNILTGINECSKYEGVRFNLAMSRNIEAIQKEGALLKKSVEPSKEYNIYESNRIKLCKDLCEKDDNGKPIMIKIKETDNNGKLIEVGEKFKFSDENKPVFDTKLKELREEHKDTIDKNDKNLKVLDELMKEEVEIELFMIDEELLPEKILRPQIDLIRPLIKFIEKK